MGFLDRNNRRPSLKQSAFRLTEEGRQKLQMSFDGSETSRILIALECESSSMDLDDLSVATRIPRGRLEAVLPGMARRGYIQMSGPGQGGEME